MDHVHILHLKSFHTLPICRMIYLIWLSSTAEYVELFSTFSFLLNLEMADSSDVQSQVLSNAASKEGEGIVVRLEKSNSKKGKPFLKYV